MRTRVLSVHSGFQSSSLFVQFHMEYFTAWSIRSPTRHNGWPVLALYFSDNPANTTFFVATPSMGTSLLLTTPLWNFGHRGSSGLVLPCAGWYHPVLDSLLSHRINSFPFRLSVEEQFHLLRKPLLGFFLQCCFLYSCCAWVQFTHVCSNCRLLSLLLPTWIRDEFCATQMPWKMKWH